MTSTFRTILSLQKADFDISHQDRILTIGSCFAENIAKKLQKGRFHVEINPFGILYNPISIAQGLRLLYNNENFPENQIVQQGEFWHSFLHHSSFGKLNRKELLSNIETNLAIQRTFVKKVNRIILTLGTANVFQYIPTNQVVANCHKIPNTQFKKRRLSIQECISAFTEVFEIIEKEQPETQIVLTVSPIRHIKDGIVENQRSKATLLLAAEQLSQKYSFVHYFPAYELMMDDLRDYRFYGSDMIHPNETAIAYIWEAFSDSFLNAQTNIIIKEIESLNTLLLHRPFFPASNEYQLFLRKQTEKEELLKNKYPLLKWD